MIYDEATSSSVLCRCVAGPSTTCRAAQILKRTLPWRFSRVITKVGEACRFLPFPHPLTLLRTGLAKASKGISTSYANSLIDVAVQSLSSCGKICHSSQASGNVSVTRFSSNGVKEKRYLQ